MISSCFLLLQVTSTRRGNSKINAPTTHAQHHDPRLPSRQALSRFPYTPIKPLFILRPNNKERPHSTPPSSHRSCTGSRLDSFTVSRQLHLLPLDRLPLVHSCIRGCTAASNIVSRFGNPYRCRVHHCYPAGGRCHWHGRTAITTTHRGGIISSLRIRLRLPSRFPGMRLPPISTTTRLRLVKTQSFADQHAGAAHEHEGRDEKGDEERPKQDQDPHTAVLVEFGMALPQTLHSHGCERGNQG